jgi:hypothetical protein
MPTLEDSLVYQHPQISGFQMYKLSDEQYVTFLTVNRWVIWREFRRGPEPTGRWGEETGLNDTYAYKAFIMENL